MSDSKFFEIFKPKNDVLGNFCTPPIFGPNTRKYFFGIFWLLFFALKKIGFGPIPITPSPSATLSEISGYSGILTRVSLKMTGFSNLVDLWVPLRSQVRFLRFGSISTPCRQIWFCDTVTYFGLLEVSKKAQWPWPFQIPYYAQVWTKMGETVAKRHPFHLHKLPWGSRWCRADKRCHAQFWGYDLQGSYDPSPPSYGIRWPTWYRGRKDKVGLLQGS